MFIEIEGAKRCKVLSLPNWAYIPVRTSFVGNAEVARLSTDKKQEQSSSLFSYLFLLI